jgi:hypothetical protein|tara:strand:+ start:61 stop:351 length:291 start_codon:yes stop_codon:yes gene_type:complete
MGKKRKILNSPKYAAKYAKHPLARAKARKSAVVEVVEAVMDTVEEVVETVAETVQAVVEDVAETVQAVVEDITEAVAPPKGLAKRRPGKKYKKSEG